MSYSSESYRRRAERQRRIVQGLKAVPCADCGARYASYVMDFDHREPDSKAFGIGAVMGNRTDAALLSEIAKCDVVCANCHRERSHLQRMEATLSASS